MVNALGGEVDLLTLKWPIDEDKKCIAIPGRVGADGVILVLPRGVIDAETLREGAGEGSTALVGPSVELQTRVEGDADTMVESIAVEFNMEIRQYLEKRAPRSRRVLTWFGEANVGSERKACCGTRDRDRAFPRRHVQDDHAQTHEGHAGQSWEETQEAARVGFLGRFVEQRRKHCVEFYFQRRQRNRGRRKIEACNEKSPRTLLGQNGEKDDGRGEFRGDGSISAREIHQRMSSGEIPHGGLCTSRLCHDSSLDVGEQAEAGETSHRENDCCFRTIPDRRKLDCSQSGYRNTGTRLGRMGSTGCRSFEKAVHLQSAERCNLDGRTYQRVEGGGMVGQKERRQGHRKSLGSQDCGKRGGRFLRWMPEEKIKPQPVKLESTPRRSIGRWLQDLVGILQDLNLPFACYARSTMALAASKAVGGKDLYPCPPPYPWFESQEILPGRSRRKRARYQKRRAIELWVNLMVCSLSHAASSLDVAPVRGRFGVKLNEHQRQMCEDLYRFASSLVRLGDDDASGCGLRLPAAEDRLKEVRSQLEKLDALPYAAQSKRFAQPSGAEAFAATKALPVVAERLSLPSRVSNFDPRPFLSPEFREIYDNPQSILKAESDMPPPIHVRGTASRSELLKVFERWDVIERLYICKSSEVSLLDRCEIFAVAKDLEKDRQILHRKRRNQREYHREGASRNLPHGVLLCQLHLCPDEVAVCSVDDVRDFYHAYEASEERARSSPVGPVLRFGEVKHLKACRQALEAGRIEPSDELVACFKGLGMGDHAAVDIAQESHVNLLKAHGALCDSETLDYKKPIPLSRSGFYEGIMIDDHLGIQILKRKSSIQATLKQPGRDETVFDHSDRAYSEVGLEAHPGKKVRRALDARVWGAQIEGCKGLVGPTRTRLVRLAKLSTVAALPGAMDEKVLEAITGQWAFCAQFRRPLFSMMHALYHQGSPNEGGGVVFDVTWI